MEVWGVRTQVTNEVRADCRLSKLLSDREHFLHHFFRRERNMPVTGFQRFKGVEHGVAACTFHRANIGITAE